MEFDLSIVMFQLSLLICWFHWVGTSHDVFSATLGSNNSRARQMNK